MNRKRLFCIILLCLLWISPVKAFDLVDFDQLFGSDLLVEIVEEKESLSLAEVMLINEGVEVGGNYNFSVGSTWAFVKNQKSKDFLTSQLNGNLFLDARPNSNFRVFTNVNVDYGKSIHISEFFSDFNIGNKVFFRGGKQTINWGVGYFFSPADVINLGRIDPENPEAQLEGPLALKVNMPVNIHNYYLYFLLDGAKQWEEIAIAPKIEFVVGRNEVGLGGYYQKSKVPRLMATISSSIKGISLFGEAMISNGSDKRFVETVDVTAENPLGLEVVKKDNLVFKGTFGARFSRTDANGLFSIAAAAQYYYNGEGYKDTSVLTNAGIVQLLSERKITAEELAEPGKHYLAGSFSWNELLNTNLSFNTLWLGNLNDKSGQVTGSLSLSTYSGITPRLGITQSYGKLGSEYNPTGNSTIVFLNVSLGSGAF